MYIVIICQLVDVNVHPNKWEVRLSKQGEMLDLIKTTIQDALNASLKTVAVSKPEKKSVAFEQPEIQYSYPVKQQPKENKSIEQSFKNYNPVVIKEKKEQIQIYEEKPAPEIKMQEEPISYPIPKEDKNDKGPEFFLHLQVLAQLHDSYILCSNEEGLVIVDQHAAQERYHYEQLNDMTINEKTAFFGIEFEPFGTDQLILREIPLWFHDVDQKQFLQYLLDYFVENQDVDMAKLRKHMIATMACHSSIRFNRPLSMQEMEQVILDLQKCKQPYHCPHGRPTVIVMSDGELRKEFERG